MTVTDEFIVDWDDPSEAELTWSHDGLHGPEPATPLGGAFAGLVSHGFKAAFAEYSVPAVMSQKIVNHWLYGAMRPLDLPPDELGRMMGEVEAKMGGAIAQLGSLWNDQYLPEIKALLEPLGATDLSALSIDELVAQWGRVRATAERLMEIHFLIILPAYVAVSEFDELYRATFDVTDPHESYRLLQGIGNMTVETGIALWELSRKLLELPEVRRVIENSTGDPSDEIALVAGGPAFLRELDTYLETYGHRGDKWDIAFPAWVEDPTPVFHNLREHLTQETHPAIELQKAAAERERLVTEARERITEDAQRGVFEFLLAAAEIGLVITEDHGFWIDFRGMYQLRRICVELGRRFAEAGVIESADDVFFLEVDELEETAQALPTLDRRDLVRDRKASFERAKLVVPPPTVGKPPGEEGPPNPIQRAMGKLFGGPPPAQEAGELRGHPGSAGKVTGTARIITSIAEADRLDEGDVLIAPATAPPWTPLFAFASAVVTDVGGILSHCAVVAREYGIPAVVGCGDATTKIRDGQTIEVDGDTGIVRVVS